MREILFRGKRIDNGEWVYGHYGEYIRFEKPISAISIPSDDSFMGNLCYDVDPTTVGEFSSLYDRKNKKIFEGDIVFYYCSDVTAIVKYGQYVDYDSPNKPATGFYVEYQEDGKTIQESVDSRESDEEYGCEVIGNIHDGPELSEIVDEP